MRKYFGTFALASLASLLFPGQANATYHTFRIDEVYSNPSGTVQFIELHEAFGVNGQNQVTLAPDIRSGSHIYTFTTDLPNANTANQYFLLATAGYSAYPGIPAPDYVIPSNFFNPAGDTLQYGSTGPDGIVDTTTFGALPSDVHLSLVRVGTSGNTFNTAVNSPTNFAGQTSSIPEPSSGALLLLASIGLLKSRRRHSSPPSA